MFNGWFIQLKTLKEDAQKDNKKIVEVLIYFISLTQFTTGNKYTCFMLYSFAIKLHTVLLDYIQLTSSSEIIQLGYHKKTHYYCNSHILQMAPSPQ